MHSIQCSVPFYTFVNVIKTDLLNEKNRIICSLIEKLIAKPLKSAKISVLKNSTNQGKIHKKKNRKPRVHHLPLILKSSRREI